MIIVLTVILVAGAAVLTYRSFNVTSSGVPVPSEDEQHKAVATAEQFALRVDGFNGDDPEAYRKSVTSLLTTKYKADFDKQFEQIQKLGIQKGQKGQGTVLASGITDMDADSATVLVVHDNTVTSSTGSGKQHSRWTIELDKVGGRWLVDDFTPVS